MIESPPINKGYLYIGVVLYGDTLHKAIIIPWRLTHLHKIKIKKLNKKTKSILLSLLSKSFFFSRHCMVIELNKTERSAFKGYGIRGLRKGIEMN